MSGQNRKCGQREGMSLIRVAFGKDKIEVSLQTPQTLSDFAFYVQRLVEQTHSFQLERARTSVEDAVQSILWQRPTGTRLDYVRTEVDYKRQTARMAIRMFMSSYAEGKSCYELYSICGSRIATMDNYEIKRE